MSPSVDRLLCVGVLSLLLLAYLSMRWGSQAFPAWQTTANIANSGR